MVVMVVVGVPTPLALSLFGSPPSLAAFIRCRSSTLLCSRHRRRKDEYYYLYTNTSEQSPSIPHVYAHALSLNYRTYYLTPFVQLEVCNLTCFALTIDRSNFSNYMSVV